MRPNKNLEDDIHQILTQYQKNRETGWRSFRQYYRKWDQRLDQKIDEYTRQLGLKRLDSLRIGLWNKKIR